MFNSPQTDSGKAPRIAIDIGVVVANLEQSLSFYRDLLGLSIVREANTSLIGRGRMIQLQHGASLIKLVEMDKAPSTQRATGISSTLGYRYITLLVTDIQTAMTILEQGQVPVVMPITPFPNGTMIAMIADPDGNVVELVEETVE